MFFNGKEYSSFWLNGKEYDKGYLNGKQIFGDSYDLATQAVINFANVNGFPLPSVAHLQALDELIKDFKNANVWNDLDRLFNFSGDGSVNFKRINLIDPSKTLGEFFGGGVIDNSGFKGNGTNAYFDTNFNPSLLEVGQKYQLNDSGFGGIVSEYPVTENSSSTFSPLLGTTLPQGRNTLYLRPTNASKINGAGVNLNSSADMSGTGFKYISRVSTTNVILINKDIEYVRTQNVSIIENSNQLGLRGIAGYGSSRSSLYFIGKSITFEKSQLMRTAINKYLTAIGQPAVA
jgi:hypothetical protein